MLSGLDNRHYRNTYDKRIILIRSSILARKYSKLGLRWGHEHHSVPRLRLKIKPQNSKNSKLCIKPKKIIMIQNRGRMYIIKSDTSILPNWTENSKKVFNFDTRGVTACHALSWSSWIFGLEMAWKKMYVKYLER